MIGGLSNLFDDRITASLYPAFLEPYAEDSGRNKDGCLRSWSSVLKWALISPIASIFSVLTAPNRSDIPPEAVLRYQATDKLGVQGALDQQGAGRDNCSCSSASKPAQA